MIYKCKIADESIGWIEMIQDINNINTFDVRKEADELLRLVVSSIATLRSNPNRSLKLFVVKIIQNF